MSSSDDPKASDVSAAGIVRLFPLPNLVMFPHVVQPLHIFEPRYCELLEDALAGDKQIAMVLLSPGWERDYEGCPAVAPVACLGQIIAHKPMPDGRHNILLRGLKRAAIRRELPLARAFRQAEVDLLEDFYPAPGASRWSHMQRQLVDLGRKLLPDLSALDDQLAELLAAPMQLGMLADIFSYTIGFSTAVKQRLLSECNVERRAELLIENLALLQAAQGIAAEGEAAFPPPFSLN
jgi:ATP-dependent Lon protease